MIFTERLYTTSLVRKKISFFKYFTSSKFGKYRKRKKFREIDQKYLRTLFIAVFFNFQPTVHQPVGLPVQHSRANVITNNNNTNTRIV